MATLYITDTGFRFPYQTWARTSTPQNLQFLEAQLGECLHSHEDDGTILWVTSQGFRMPHKKTKENLEGNMKYVETQLEKYLHDHETTTTTSEEETNVVIDTEVDLTTDPILGAGDSIPDDADVYFWANDETEVAVSQANPHIGSNHIRSTVSGGVDNAEIFPMDPAESRINRPRFAVLGDTVTASVWARQDPPSGDALTFEFLFHNSADNSNGFDDSNVIGSLTDEYQLFETAEVTLPDDTAWVGVQIRAPFTSGLSYVTDFDTFAMNATVEVESSLTLFINDAGFRFPYGWEKEGDINHNMKFLELEISQYLHKHEEGT